MYKLNSTEVGTLCKTQIKTKCNDFKILSDLYSVENSTKTIFNVQTDKLIVGIAATKDWERCGTLKIYSTGKQVNC